MKNVVHLFPCLISLFISFTSLSANRTRVPLTNTDFMSTPIDRWDSTTIAQAETFFTTNALSLKRSSRIALCSQIIRACSSNRLAKKEAYYYSQLANIHYQSKDAYSGIKYTLIAINKGTEAGVSPAILASYYIDYAEFQVSLGEYQAALSAIQKAEGLHGEYIDHRIQFMKGDVLFYLHEFMEAEKVFLALEREIPDTSPELLSNLQYTLANCYLARGIYKKAEHYLHLSETTVLETNAPAALLPSIGYSKCILYCYTQNRQQYELARAALELKDDHLPNKACLTWLDGCFYEFFEKDYWTALQHYEASTKHCLMKGNISHYLNQLDYLIDFSRQNFWHEKLASYTGELNDFRATTSQRTSSTLLADDQLYVTPLKKHGTVSNRSWIILGCTLSVVSGGMLFLRHKIKQNKLLSLNTKTDRSEAVVVSAASSDLEEQKMIQRLEALLRCPEVIMEQELSLHKMAALLNTNASHLSDVVRKEYQLDYSTYINQSRVKEFCRRVKLSDLESSTVESLVFLVGFKSKSTFNKIFFDLMGLTPYEFIQHRHSTAQLLERRPSSN